MKTLIIDNYDSYTYNLYQLIAEVNGEIPMVIRNNEIEWEDLKKLRFDNIVISPGPGRPENPKDFGICRQVIENIKQPILGVCLGHQGIGYLYGGSVINAPEVRHGRLSQIYHNGCELFDGIANPFAAVRYHSLLVAEKLPDCLEKIAWTEEGLVMGLRHRYLPLWGVQFHPESICTEYGRNLLENFQKITKNYIINSDIYKNKIKIISNYKQPKNQHKFTVISKKLDIYLDTEQIFVNLFGQQKNTFWLDSSQVEGLARFSFMGDANSPNSQVIRYYSHNQELIITQSGKITSCRESIFDYLQQAIDRLSCFNDELPFNFNCGFVGYFGYELKGECGGKLVNTSSVPDAIFILAERMIAIDHHAKAIYLLHLSENAACEKAQEWFELIKQKLNTLTPLEPIKSHPQSDKVTFCLSRSYQTYIEDIKICLKEIHEGETYQVCLTNQLITDVTPEPLSFYRILRRINPAPYSAFLRFEDLAIACSSPERFLKIDCHGWVETKPIKGTIRRGNNPQEDLYLREHLRNNEKDRAENLMIVDLLRNDLGRTCEVGSVKVPKLMDVETYATVHQLVTTIRGHLCVDSKATDCIRAAFPGGSMTGAPKIRTMEIIDRLEQQPRGIYSGAIGFLGLNGTVDLNIVIRTAVITSSQTSIGIGGSIVALSDPEMEFQETLLKAKALIEALLICVCGEFKPNQYRIADLNF